MIYKCGNKYPYTDDNLRRDRPRVSFPARINDTVRVRYGMVPVSIPPQPAPTPGKKYRLSDTLTDGALTWVEYDVPLEQQYEAAQAECKRRILEVVSTTMQINMAAASAAGLLTEDQKAAYINGLGWIQSMRETWRQLVDDGLDVYDDMNWPLCPDDAAEFANQF